MFTALNKAPRDNASDYDSDNDHDGPHNEAISVKNIKCDKNGLELPDDEAQGRLLPAARLNHRIHHICNSRLPLSYRFLISY
jgi:hypothetical protein